MNKPTFDIFRGSNDKDAVWVEAVAGVANARDRMQDIAESRPDEYFVFSQELHEIVARIDTREIDFL